MKLFAMPAVLLSLISFAASAQENPLATGWTLQEENSKIEFQSLKNGSKLETSTFAGFTGTIDPDGTARLEIALDSVDTKVDLRNVRMRFLFFETFNFPSATVSLRIPKDLLVELEAERVIETRLPFELDLHGVTQDMTADVSVSLNSFDEVIVETTDPVVIDAAQFDLTGGIAKLEDAAKVKIMPRTAVATRLVFKRDSEADILVASTASDVTETETRNGALETAGNFSPEACIGRFEILSRSGNINFQSNSDELQPSSEPILAEVVDIVSRCPDLSILIAGHTDSVGDPNYNQYLSEQRAASVAAYLNARGDFSDRIASTGFGEASPIASNFDAAGRRLNRRIEFRVQR